MIFRTLILFAGVLLVHGGGGGFSGFQEQRQGMSGGYNGGGYNGGSYNGGGYNGGDYMGGGRSMYDNGGYDNGYNNGGGYIVPVATQDTSFLNQNTQRYGNSGGNAAAAGNAGASGPGQATSINQANHHATRFATDSSGLSANTASGFGPQTSGAAQAGGQLESGSLLNTQFGRKQGTFIGRRKRSYYPDNYFYGPNQGNSNAIANSIGGGSGGWGQLGTSNNAVSFTNPNSATGFAAGNAWGNGGGLNIFNAANSQTSSFGRR